MLFLTGRFLDPPSTQLRRTSSSTTMPKVRTSEMRQPSRTRSPDVTRGASNVGGVGVLTSPGRAARERVAHVKTMPLGAESFGSGKHRTDAEPPIPRPFPLDSESKEDGMTIKPPQARAHPSWCSAKRTASRSPVGLASPARNAKFTREDRRRG